MDFAHWILIINLALSFYNVGAIWLMQVLIYPLWALVGPAQFASYHLAHWRRLPGVIFLPAALSLMGAILMIWFHPQSVAPAIIWLALGCQILVYALTAIWWVPMQIRLSKEGPSSVLLQKLIQSHWLRTALITIYALLLLGMLISSVAVHIR